MSIPDTARRYVTSDDDGVLPDFVKRHLAVPPLTVQFPIASLIWSTDHDFGRLPRVALYNLAGKQIYATTTVTPVDATILFSEPMAGTLILS